MNRHFAAFISILSGNGARKRHGLASATAAGFIAFAVLAATGASAGRGAGITSERLAAHTNYLASDALQGRGPGTAGEAATIRYLIAQFAAAGLQPGGDVRDGRRTWTQDVPLIRTWFRGPISLEARVAGEALSWRQTVEVAIRPSRRATQVSFRDAPIVFAGYGVDAPERRWNDFEGLDLHGKIIMVLVNDPDFETGAGDFGGRAMTYYGRWTYKFEEAARQGALGVLVVHETAPASYGWESVVSSNTAVTFDIVHANQAVPFAMVEGWIHRDAAADLLRRAGLDFETLKRQARQRGFRAVPIPGATLSADYTIDREQIVSHNVAAIARGSRRPDETVILTSHWDHLGVGPADAAGDTIYNGAVDNAGGVAVLLEVARAIGRARTQRSVLFLATTGEENGQLGANFYAENPLYPLATTVADINFDALEPTGAARDISTLGVPQVSLLGDLIAVARGQGRSFSPDPTPEAGSYFRYDHFPFARHGVPAISIRSGSDLLYGGRAASARWDAAYIAARYHRPSDQLDAQWDWTGIVQDAELIRRLALRLANAATWPEWDATSEFRAFREATAESRR